MGRKITGVNDKMSRIEDRLASLERLKEGNTVRANNGNSNGNNNSSSGGWGMMAIVIIIGVVGGIGLWVWIKGREKDKKFY